MTVHLRPSRSRHHDRSWGAEHFQRL